MKSTAYKFFSSWVLMLIACCKLSGQEQNYYFFSEEDIIKIRTSSQTDWGRKIINSLQQTVEERLKHEMEVPMLEGGHGHDYFCPVHNVQFTFNWEKPTSHYCALCGKEWSKVNKYNWAWVNSVHNENLKFLQSCMYLYLITKDVGYAAYIRDMMLDYALKYPTYIEHNTVRKPTVSYSGKMFAQSLDESVWASYACKAYSIARGIMTSEEIQAIEKGYLQECANLLLNRKAQGNWQVWHNSGLIALGVALRNDSIIQVALQDPKHGYYKLMSTDVYDDGWWNEGSPIYHYYPLRAMLLSADALRCKGINLYDKKLYNMLASPALGVYSDLYFPAHNDGWYGESLTAQASLYELAYYRYNDPLFLSILERCYKKTKRNSMDALFNNIPIGNSLTQVSSKSVYFPNTGYAVLRSDDKSVVLKYGPHGGGHGHPDKLSISIHNGKEELVTDLGTSAYGVPDYMQWYRKTLAHSTVTIDARDQNPTTGRLVSFSSLKNGGIVETQTSEAYPGVEMSRKLNFTNNRLTDDFNCTSSDVHTYDYVLILTKKPQLQGNGINATLTDSETYKRISNVKKYVADRSVKCKIEGAEIQISLASGNEKLEIFTGEAPGIPPKNPAVSNGDDASKPCYPLIIRVKSKNMNIHTEWTFD